MRNNGRLQPTRLSTFMAPHFRGLARPAVYGGLIVAVFALDVVTPRGLNVPLLYLIPLLFAFLVEGVPTRLCLTLLVTVLTAVAALLWSDKWPVGVINRCFDLGVFWVALVLSIRDARTIGELKDLRNALDNASIVSIADGDGVIRHANQRFCEISKYSREELVGRDHRILSSGTHSKAFMRSLWSTIADGRIWHGEIHNRAKDGSLYWVDATIVPFLDARGKPYRYLALHNDISPRKRAEARLRNQAALAKLGEMAAIVAHEVRNPVAGVRAALEIFGGRLSLPAAERHMVRQMVERLDLLNAHVSDLLQFAKPRSPQVEAVRLRLLLDDVVRLILQTDAHVGVGCQIVGPDALVFGDKMMLHEIFTNLLLNAAQAVAGRGHIVVTLAGTDDALDVFVADNGPGIPPPLRERVFEPFYTTKAAGTGLGLGIVKQLVELQGGEIEVVNGSSPGTTMRVRLPRAHAVPGVPTGTDSWVEPSAS